MKIESRYMDGTYLAANTDWDRQDAPWKASLVRSILSDYNINPSSICEVGCGSGDVLINLSSHMPETKMTGFDISPQAAAFWEKHRNAMADKSVQFILGDFDGKEFEKSDVLIMLDVFEHVRDPFSFLERSRNRAKYFVFHIPLDLSAGSVVRNSPLIKSREKAGHLHYYTKDLALATLRETGYEILDWRYTGASFHSPQRSWKTLLASIPRRLIFAVNKDFGVRLLGGETLLVLAKDPERNK